MSKDILRNSLLKEQPIKLSFKRESAVLSAFCFLLHFVVLEYRQIALRSNSMCLSQISERGIKLRSENRP